MSKIKGITIEIGGDVTPLQRAIKSLNSETNALQRELRGVETLLKLDPKNVDLLKQRQDLLTGSVENTKNKLDELKKAKEQADKDMAEGTELNQKEYRNLQREIVLTESNLKDYENQLKTTNSTLHDMGIKLEEVGGKLKSTGGNITDIGDGLTRKVTAPIIAATAASVTFATTAESAFANVRKVIDTTEEGYENLKDGVDELLTTIPSTRKEMYELLATSGEFKISEKNLISYIEVMKMLEDTTSLTGETAAESIARIISLTDMAEEEASNFGSAVVELGNNFIPTESQIVSMTEKISGVGSQLKMSQADVLAWSTFITSAGLSADVGGTAFNKFAREVELATALGGENLETFASTAGLSADKFTKLFKDDATSAMLMFFEGLKDIESQGGSVTKVLDDLGIRESNLSNMFILGSKSVDTLKDALIASNNAWTENTALTEEAGIKYGTTESEIKRLMNSVTNLLTSLGEIMIPAVKEIIETLQSTFDKINSLDDGIKKVIVTVGLIIAAIGPILSIGGKLISGIGGLMEVIGPLLVGLGESGGLAGAFSALTGPIGIVIGAIAAIGVTLVALYKDSEEFRDSVSELWEAIKEMFETVTEAISNVITTGFNNIKDFMEKHGETISKITSTVWGAIESTVIAITKIITGVIQAFTGLITGDWGTFSDGLKKIWSTLWDSIKNIVSGAWGLLKGAFGSLYDSISGWFSGLIDDALGWGKNMIQGFIDGISSMISSVKDTISGVMSTVKDFLGFESPTKKGEGRHIVEWGENMIDGFMEGMNNIRPKLQMELNAVIPKMPDTGRNQVAMAGTQIVIQNMSVRDESDIDKIAQKLYEIEKRSNRSGGGRL